MHGTGIFSFGSTEVPTEAPGSTVANAQQGTVGDVCEPCEVGYFKAAHWLHGVRDSWYYAQEEDQLLGEPPWPVYGLEAKPCTRSQALYPNSTPHALYWARPRPHWSSASVRSHRHPA